MSLSSHWADWRFWYGTMIPSGEESTKNKDEAFIVLNENGQELQKQLYKYKAIHTISIYIQRNNEELLGKKANYNEVQ